MRRYLVKLWKAPFYGIWTAKDDDAIQRMVARDQITFDRVMCEVIDHPSRSEI